jgi:hypothetical protein
MMQVKKNKMLEVAKPTNSWVLSHPHEPRNECVGKSPTAVIPKWYQKLCVRK